MRSLLTPCLRLKFVKNIRPVYDSRSEEGKKCRRLLKYFKTLCARDANLKMTQIYQILQMFLRPKWIVLHHQPGLIEACLESQSFFNRTELEDNMKIAFVVVSIIHLYT